VTLTKGARHLGVPDFSREAAKSAKDDQWESDFYRRGTEVYLQTGLGFEPPGNNPDFSVPLR
jgi:hypothetical protein